MTSPSADSNKQNLTVRRRRGWISRLFADVLFVVKRERKWWLLPLILLLLLLGLLLVFAIAAGPLAPFIYPLL